MTKLGDINVIEEPEEKIIKTKIGYKTINLIYLGMALLIPTIVSYFIVLFFTSSIGVISRQLWTLPIIWPEQLYLGGIIGGFLGAIVGILDIWMVNNRDREIRPGKMLSPDLYYIIILIGFTYVLQFISDSLVPQIIFFLLEIGIFLIIGWNLSKILLETETEAFIEEVTNFEESQKEKPEIEKYMSE